MLRLNKRWWRSISGKNSEKSAAVFRVLQPDYTEFGHFTSLVCRGRQRNVQRFITHVHNHCSPQVMKPFSFSLPSTSWFAQVPCSVYFHGLWIVSPAVFPQVICLTGDDQLVSVTERDTLQLNCDIPLMTVFFTLQGGWSRSTGSWSLYGGFTRMYKRAPLLSRVYWEPGSSGAKPPGSGTETFFYSFSESEAFSKQKGRNMTFIRH